MKTMKEAQEAGFATFNDQPHLCIDIPDGSHTITVRTSEGKTVTFAFQSYTKDGAPQCIDIAREDQTAGVWDNGGESIGRMRAFNWEDGQRKVASPNMVTVLMDEGAA
jgi:hypothetical protein